MLTSFYSFETANKTTGFAGSTQTRTHDNLVAALRQDIRDHMAIVLFQTLVTGNVEAVGVQTELM